MSLGILDGAEHQLPTPQLFDVSASVPPVYVSNGRYTGTTYLQSGQTGPRWRVPAAVADPEVWIGVAAFHNPTMDGSSDANAVLTILGDGATVTHLSLFVSSTGVLSLRRGLLAGTLLGSSAAGAVVVSTWYFLEVHAIIDDTVGAYEVRVDGVNVLSATGVDTRNGGTSPNVTVFGVGRGSTDRSWYDDVYCVTGDGSGASGFQSEITIEKIQPNGNGNYSQLVGQDGDSTNNYLNVDEIPFSSTDYNGSATVANKDTYTYSNLTSTAGTIIGSVIHFGAYKNLAGFIKGRRVIRIGGVDYNGSDTPVLSGTTRYFSEVMAVSPATAAAWTISEVNGLEAGFEVRSA